MTQPNNTNRDEGIVKEAQDKNLCFKNELDFRTELRYKEATDWLRTILSQVRTQAYTQGREDEREIVEQAHMAGYHSCCNRDPSYSDARSYYDTITHPKDKE